MSGITRYVRFWDQRETAESLALVRIGVGLVMLFDLLQVARYGLVRTLWATIEQGGLGPSSDAEPRVMFYAWFGASSASTYALFALSLVVASTLALGLCTRLSALALVFCSAQLSTLAPAADRGIDGLLRGVLILIALSGAGATWSLDARLRMGRFKTVTIIPAWPRYLLIAQLCLVYVTAGILKQTPEWTSLDGYSALWRVLNTPHISRFEWSPDTLSRLYTLLQAATITTLIFERGAVFVPFLLWLRAHPARGGWLGACLRRVRALEVWIATGVVFHVMLALFTKLGIFPWGCLALYPALVRPGSVRNFLYRL
jgi:hypothetical protein